MLRRFSDKTQQFTWIDLTDPSATELGEIVQEFGLPQPLVDSCLDPVHLPMYEELEASGFMILRHADGDAYGKEEADTVLELTRKLAIFAGKNFVITVHRKEQPFLERMLREFPQRKVEAASGILATLFRHVLHSYESPLADAETAFDRFEEMVFDSNTTASLIRQLYFLKRKVSVYKRMIRQTLDVMLKVNGTVVKTKAEVRAIQEEGTRIYFFSNELEEDASHLLDTHLLLSSNRTNDIVRVLTLFSVFFMPLTFIVGVYGMNFRVLPELEWQWGYAGVWGLMIGVAAVIFVWFRSKGWLK